MKLFSTTLLLICAIFSAICPRISGKNQPFADLGGQEAYDKAQDLFAVGRFEDAAELYWTAIVKLNTRASYKVCAEH